ncbi:hypothetical protein [Microlunatus sp. Y2014]|uniref:hypothetical protein n=1 Tax=Microlunatus sp. Y2014 TaxID=3418488 RepID=UPI003DA6D34D
MSAAVMDEQIVACPECGALERVFPRGRRVEYRHIGRVVGGCVVDLVERKMYREADNLRLARLMERERRS